MVEVFKTDVEDQDLANKLIDHIHKTFTDYKANFDLQDCDRILRVNCVTGNIECNRLICLLKQYGCNAEILEGEIIQFTGEKIND